MIEHADRIEIYPSLWRSAFLIVVCGFFVWVGIHLGTGGSRDPRTHPWEVLLAAYVGVPVAGWIGLVTAYRLLSGRPLLVIDAAGITDSSSTLGTRQVSWDEVDHLLWFQSRRRESGLRIIPKDVEAFWRRRGSVARFLAKLQHPFGEPPVNIGNATLSVPSTELADLLHSRYGVRVEGRALDRRRSS